MKELRIFLYLISLLILGLIHHMPVSAEIFNRIVAKVNSDVITLHELNSKIKEITGKEANDLIIQDEEKYLETRLKILDLLIDEKIAGEKIQELGINVTPKQVDAAIEEIKKNNHITHEDLVAGLKNRGISYESYRKNIKSELEKRQLINYEVKSKIIIREEKIKEYYNQHIDKFTSEEKIRLATIFLKKENNSDQKRTGYPYEKAEEILLKIRSGEHFGELAKKFSQGPGAEEGGNLGFFKTSQLDPQLRKIIKELPEGGVSDLIISQSGIQIIMLVEKQEQKVKPINEIKDAIYEILYRQEVDKRYSIWIKELRKKAYTKILF